MRLILAVFAPALIAAPAVAQTLGGSSVSGRTIDTAPAVTAPAPAATPAPTVDDALANEAAERVAANGEGSASVDVAPGQSVAVTAASRCYHQQASWAPVKRGDGYVCENRGASIGAPGGKKARRRHL